MTGNTSVIGILQAGDLQLGDREFQIGDAIGAFFTRNDQRVCAGYMVWDGVNFGFSVRGDNDQTAIKDGYAVNENYYFKVWDSQLGAEWPAEFSVQSGNGYYTVNGVTILSMLRAITTIEQNIPLAEGWNMISAYLTPTNPSVSAILNQISPELVLMKNIAGQAHWPGFMTTLSVWNTQESYMLYANAQCSLMLRGFQIKPETEPVNFANVGWYWIPYYRTSSMPPVQALANISGNYTLIKSVGGQVYWAGFINTLASLEPNNGYLLHINSPANLIYPANASVPSGKVLAEEETVSSQYLKADYENTGSSAVLAFEISGAAAGDEVGIYTQGGQLIGSGVYGETKGAAVIWGDNEISTNFKDGAYENEELTLKLYSKASGSLINLDIISAGDYLSGEQLSSLAYKTDAVYMIKAEVNPLSVADEVSTFAISPQPVTDEAVISFTSLEYNSVTIEVYDLKGSLLNTYTFSDISSGVNKLRINTSEYSSGIYNIILKSGKDIHQAKMVKAE